MSVTVKLIIELPTDKYLAVKTNMINDFIYDAVKHGMPLNDVIAKVKEDLDFDEDASFCHGGTYDAFHRGVRYCIESFKEVMERNGE